jgi:hypothetical protein
MYVHIYKWVFMQHLPCQILIEAMKTLYHIDLTTHLCWVYPACFSCYSNTDTNLQKIKPNNILLSGFITTIVL